WASVKRSLFIRISSILTLRKFSFKSHSFYGGITLAGFYKIKLLKDGYRLVYQVIDERIVIYVIAVGRRADNEIYALATKRTD
ncbi:type II toxin-antitoxin system RelE family toxin, partial [Acetobacter indonesiensis]|uniref:type II toxin-antitoxin system RelE family toxin n=1 Tax=Acetobacter indonesiensis TaxID=104101 RepID=UPI0020A558E1